MVYYLNIGTNLGNRQNNINHAIALIESRLGVVCKRSSIVESEAWGYESPNQFMNIGIAFESDIDAEEMLKTVKHIESILGSASHRTARGDYADRLIDIDIVAIDEISLSTPNITIPHSHLHERSFFLQPMCELNEDWKHPILGKTVKKLFLEISKE